MMKVKQFNQEQIDLLNTHIADAYTTWGKVWEIAMKGLKINSSEYRAICHVGKEMNSIYLDLDRTAAQLSLKFEDKTKKYCSFN